MQIRILIATLALVVAGCGPADSPGVTSVAANTSGETRTSPDNASAKPDDESPSEQHLTLVEAIVGGDGWSFTPDVNDAKQLALLVENADWQKSASRSFHFPDYYAKFNDETGAKRTLYVSMPSGETGDMGSALWNESLPDESRLSDGPTLLAIVAFFTEQKRQHPFGDDPRDEHAVLSKGDVFIIHNKNGVMRVEAESNRKRTFSWDGVSRSVFMISRRAPWHGALGLYWPGSGDHWEEHAGVTRGVVSEEQRDFEDEATLRAWLKDCENWYDAKYTPDGVVAGWSITVERNQLNVEVWRISIGGEQPTALAGGSTDWLTWTHEPK